MSRRKKGLIKSYSAYILIPILTLVLFLAATLALVTFYAYTSSMLYIFIFDAIGVSFLVGYIIFYFRMRRRMKKTLYQQLYLTTYTNITKLRNNDTNFVSYGESDFKEIALLDKATSDIKTKLDSSYLVAKSFDYSTIKLEYVDEQSDLITFKSFKDNLANIIFVSQSFRNILIDVYYDLPDDTKFTDEDKTRLLALYREAFKEHEHVLFMFGEEERSLLIYVPIIDSFNEIKEKLNYVVPNSSIMVRDSRGINNVPAKYAIVAYPYSNEDMMIGDLLYAKSKGLPFNLYLPTRYKSNLGSKLMINTAMNLNYTSKIMAELSHLDYSATNNESNFRILKNVFDAIANFLDIDDAGIIHYNPTMGRYDSYVSSKRSTLFKENNISNEFVEELSKVVDDDEAYYFSTRKHASMSLQQVLALYGIESGTYYIVKDLDGKRVDSIIYLFNRNKDLTLNTYLRETFLIVSLRIENYFEKRDISDYADAKDTENQNILALSNMFVYHIDDEYKITYLSKGISKVFRGLKVGDKCYHAFFGTDKPCRDCPLASKKKKYFEHSQHKYETSLTLSDRKDEEKVIFIRRLAENEVVGDLFQEDFLTYSYKAFVATMRNEYETSSRGYSLILAIDNYEEIVSELGAEGYNYLIRDYVRNLKNKLGIDDVYYYNPSAIAIHLPSVGHKDIINTIEDIYPLSKVSYYENKGFKKINISYLPVGYPRGYAHAEDYLKHMSDFYRSPKLERNKDFIYFADYSIERSASKREFMISVLESEFSGHNSTSMNLQPIVRVKDGHIYGAEILLRIADAHRNVFFNAQEISQIAEQENKTGMITESIINFIGTMYKEYGNNVFKINDFNRIAINIDQTYLDNEELVTKLISLSEENKLPNGFVSLEIPEDLVPNNKDKIANLARELSKYKILFSCDRYTAQYADIEELAHLGFNEVKVARDIILKIDRDQIKLGEMKNIVAKAKQNNISVAAVGVENEAQYNILKGLDEEMMVQGYYLYKPLTRADLITALISYKD